MAEIIELARYASRKGRAQRAPEGPSKVYSKVVERLDFDHLERLIDQMNRERDLLLKGKSQNE